MALSDLFSRRRKDESDPESAAPETTAQPTKALAKFLNTLQGRAQPVLLDLGPVVGSNLTFFGEQLGCKIFVEDLYKDIDRCARDGKDDEVVALLEKRFPQPDSSFDGILCWDVFDYLDKRAAQVLARELSRLLRAEGALMALFGATEAQATAAPAFTRFMVVDATHVQHRSSPAARAKGRPLPNRDIQRIFEPLRITEQFLLKNNIREVLFRKVVTPAAAAPGSGV